MKSSSGNALSSFVIWMPQPPSVNDWWQPVKNGESAKMVLTPRARKFKLRARPIIQTCIALAGAAPYCPLAEKVHLEVIHVPATRRTMDSDNFLKGTFDSMTGLVYGDDAQVANHEVDRGPVSRKYAGMYVRVTLAQKPMATLPGWAMAAFPY